MKVGSIVKTTFDYLAKSPIYIGLGWCCNNWPTPEGEYMVRDLIPGGEHGVVLVLEEVHMTNIHMPGVPCGFNIHFWREIQPPLDIEALVEESICQLV